jgi:hypothetical protein
MEGKTREIIHLFKKFIRVAIFLLFSCLLCAEITLKTLKGRGHRILEGIFGFEMTCFRRGVCLFVSRAKKIKHSHKLHFFDGGSQTAPNTFQSPQFHC